MGVQRKSRVSFFQDHDPIDKMMSWQPPFKQIFKSIFRTLDMDQYTYLLRYFVEVPSAASGPSHCPTTLIYLCSSPATSLSSGKCIQQPGACLVL